MGIRRRILADSGCLLGGALFSDLRNAYGSTVISSPLSASYLTGKVDRGIQHLKKSPEAIQGRDLLGVDHHSRLALSVLAYYVTPEAGSNASPITAIIGRSEFPEDRISTPPVKSDQNHPNGTFRFFARINSIRPAKYDLMQNGAAKPARACIRSKTHAGAREILRADDLIDIWRPGYFSSLLLNHT